MLSAPTFKDELARYDEFLVRALDDYIQPRQKRKPAKRLTVDRQHLHDWMADSRAQDVWTAIRAHAPTMAPQEFIRAIFKARRDAVALINRLNARRDERAYWMDKYGKEAARLFVSRLSTADIAERLEAMADGLRCLEEYHSFLIPDEVKISRKNQNGSRVRKLFAQQVSRLFHKICKQWRDWDVMVLTEIAFPGRKLDEAQIRAWRRPISDSLKRGKAPPTHH